MGFHFMTKDQILSKLNVLEAQLDTLRTEIEENDFEYACLTADDLSSDSRKLSFMLDELVNHGQGIC
jgi:hypothetical protein